MKKAVIILLSLSMAAMAQKPKVAVGAVGEEPENFKALKFLSSKLSEAITNSGEYEGVELSEDISKLVVKELQRQESGDVDEENQIIKVLGKQSIVDYLCIVQSEQIEKKVGGMYLLEVKFVDVESQTRPIMKTETSSLNNMNELEIVANKLARQILDSDAKEERARQEREREREQERQAKLDAYQNFTQLERFGTFALNHAFGLGSLLIMENTGTAGLIALFEAMGVALYVFGSSIKMPDKSSYKCEGGFDECNDEFRYNSNGDSYDGDKRGREVLKYALLVPGLVTLAIVEICSAATSFGYDKPKPVAGLADPRNLRLAVLPNKNGNGMVYGLMYNTRF